MACWPSRRKRLTVGISSAAAYPNDSPRGFLPNQGVAAAPVNTPLIFEPPPSLTNNVAEVWVGASGGSAGVADPNWGGAFVWISIDNVSYSQIATITQPLRQGVLTASLPSSSGWDAIHTLRDPCRERRSVDRNLGRLGPTGFRRSRWSIPN